MSLAKELVPGLAGVPAAESAISYIDGMAGILKYRGYSIESLSESSSFEETAWLLWHGELPKASALDEFRTRLARARELPAELIAAIGAMPAKGHPMKTLQAGTALLAMYREGSSASYAQPAEREQAWIDLVAAMPVLVAAFDRSRKGLPFVAPDPDLDTAANFLWMLTGEKPDELAVRILDVALILHADHTMNASTFTARVVGSTEADPYAVVSAALGSLTGPLHGGANERVLDSLDAIGSRDEVEAWLDDKMAKRSKVMGFGHRVYKVKDPRAFCLQGLVRQLFDKLGTTPIYDIALRLEELMAERVGHKGIYPNVDFYSGIVYQKLGIETDLFTPVFAISRVSGWLAHWNEQMLDNKLFRPGQIFVGENGREYVGLEAR